MTRLAVTGHRPDKLGGYKAYERFTVIRLHMIKTIGLFSNPELISGGALGIDQLWIEAGLFLRVPVIAALPFEGYDSTWPAASQQKYRELLDKCLEVRYISEPGYAPHKLQTRNKWTVDNSDLLVAYWTGVGGGTKNCIDYATTKHAPIITFHPDNI